MLFFCINIFFSAVAMTKTFQHLKQWQPTSVLSAFSLESVRIIVSHYCFCLQGLYIMGTLLFTCDVFEWVHFCNVEFCTFCMCMLQCTFMYWPYSYPFESIKSAVLDKTVEKIAYLHEGHFFKTS